MQTVDKTQHTAQSSHTLSENTASMVAPDTATHQTNGDVTLGFFMVGIVINIVMIIAYFIWAYKNWNNKNRDKNS